MKRILFFESIKDTTPKPVSTDELLDRMANDELVQRITNGIREQYDRYRAGKLANWEDYKKAYDPLKRQLPAVAWQAREFTDGRRHAGTAVPSGLYMLDVDHMEQDPKEFYNAHIRGHEKEWGVVYASGTPSRVGLRCVGVLPQGMDIPQAQEWLAGKLGVRHDEACKDLSRLSFLVGMDQLYYIDKLALDKGEWQQPVAEQPAPSVAAPSSAQPSSAVAPKQYPTAYKDIPYATILAGLNGRWGGEPAEGSRNAREYDLAKHLAPITDRNVEWLRQIIPNYEQDEVKWLEALARGAKNGYVHPSADLKAVLAALSAPQGGDGGLEPLPRNLPRSLKIFLEYEHKDAREVVATAIFPALATLWGNATYRGDDNRLHRPILEHGTVSRTGDGKSYIERPCNLILANVKATDAVNRARFDKWQKENRKRGENHGQVPYPEDCPIRNLGTDATNAQLLRIWKGNYPYSSYLYAPEIEMLERFGDRRGRSYTIYQLMKLSFDDSTWTVERAGIQSESGVAHPRMNVSFAGTAGAICQSFRQEVTTGTFPRVYINTYAQLPDEINLSATPPRNYPADMAAQVEPYLQRLCGVQGELACHQLLRFMARLRQELEEKYAGDKTRKMYARRTLIIIERMGIILWVMEGRQWSKAIENFMRWAILRDVELKTRLFPNAFDEDEQVTQRLRGHRPSQLSQLPDTFTADEFVQFYAARGKTEKQARAMLRKWKSRREIEQLEDGRWHRKCDNVTL